MKKILLIALVALLQPLLLWAQGMPELNTDRPNATQSPTVVPLGSWQLEGGFQYQQEDLHDSQTKEILYPEVLLRWGVLEWAELRLQSAYKVERKKWTYTGQPIERYNTDGIQDLQAGAKVNVFQGRGVIPEIGLLGNLTLPVGHKDFRPPHLAPEGRLLFNNKISEVVELQYNAGYRKRQFEDELRGETLYSLVCNLKMLHTFTWFTEFYGFNPQGAAAENWLDVGLQVLLRPDLQWDLSYGGRVSGVRIMSDERKFFIGTGLSWRWDR
ncbi:MAG: transporter [Adhaeribacter sp.]